MHIIYGYLFFCIIWGMYRCKHQIDEKTDKLRFNKLLIDRENNKEHADGHRNNNSAEFYFIHCHSFFMLCQCPSLEKQITQQDSSLYACSITLSPIDYACIHKTDLLSIIHDDPKSPAPWPTSLLHLKSSETINMNKIAQQSIVPRKASFSPSLRLINGFI